MLHPNVAAVVQHLSADGPPKAFRATRGNTEQFQDSVVTGVPRAEGSDAYCLHGDVKALTAVGVGQRSVFLLIPLTGYREGLWAHLKGGLEVDQDHLPLQIVDELQVDPLARGKFGGLPVDQ